MNFIIELTRTNYFKQRPRSLRFSRQQQLLFYINKHILSTLVHAKNKQLARLSGASLTVEFHPTFEKLSTNAKAIIKDSIHQSIDMREPQHTFDTLRVGFVPYYKLLLCWQVDYLCDSKPVSVLDIRGDVLSNIEFKVTLTLDSTGEKL